MKKLLALILAVVMAFSMAGCGGGETNKGGEVSGEGTADTQPVGKVEQGFDFKSLGSYGLPEPSFGYSYKFHEEVMQGMGDDGEPILKPQFTFEINTDRVGAHEYMGQVLASGWAGEVPYLTEDAGGAFWYTSEDETYKINITWDDTTDSGVITIIDKTKLCVASDELDFLVIEGVDKYEDYAPYISAQ